MHVLHPKTWRSHVLSQADEPRRVSNSKQTFARVLLSFPSSERAHCESLNGLCRFAHSKLSSNLGPFQFLTCMAASMNLQRLLPDETVFNSFEIEEKGFTEIHPRSGDIHS